MKYLSGLLIPMIIFGMTGYGWSKKTDCYASFRKGTVKGCKIVLELLPTLMGLIMAVQILRASGLLTWAGTLGQGILEGDGLHGEIISLILVKVISSSAAIGVLIDIFKQYGTDTKMGLAASLILSSTETIFYCVSIYFLKTDVKKTRWTIPGALLATGAGVAASIYLAGMI